MPLVYTAANVGGYYVSNKSEKVSSAQSPAQLHCNVPKPWVLDTLRYLLAISYQDSNYTIVNAVMS